MRRSVFKRILKHLASRSRHILLVVVVIMSIIVIIHLPTCFLIMIIVLLVVTPCTYYVYYLGLSSGWALASAQFSRLSRQWSPCPEEPQPLASPTGSPSHFEFSRRWRRRRRRSRSSSPSVLTGQSRRRQQQREWRRAQFILVGFWCQGWRCDVRCCGSLQGGWPREVRAEMAFVLDRLRPFSTIVNWTAGEMNRFFYDPHHYQLLLGHTHTHNINY